MTIDLGLELFPEDLSGNKWRTWTARWLGCIPVELDQRSLSVRVYSVGGLPHVHKLLHLVYLTSKIIDFSGVKENERRVKVETE